MATTAPIGRISFQDADPATQAANAPPPESTNAPTINPSDSPYTPLSLPQVTPAQAPQLPPKQDQQNIGAASRGGAIAYLADGILRGAMQGYDQAQAKKADQFNKKLAAQQAIYNDQAKQLHDMAVAGVDPNSDEFKQAQNRVLTSWQATMQTIGQRIPQPKKSSKSQQGQQQGQDQSSLLQRALNHKQDPQDALQAVYQGAISTGPPVFHQIQPYLSPAYRAKQQQGAQTQATQATTAGTNADTAKITADMNHELQTLQAKPEPTEADKARIEQLREAASPTARQTPGQFREYKRPDGSLGWYDVSKPETIPQGSSAVGIGAAGKAPKLGWTKVDGKWGSQNYDPETNQPVPGTFDSTKVPPSNVLALYPTEHTLTGKFVDSNGVLQTYGTTSTSHRELPGGIGEGGSGSSAISHRPKTPAASSGTTPPVSTGSKTTPIGYVGSTGYKQAVKQATDAQKEFNGASTGLNYALKTADAAKHGDGPAQVGILATYLKTVVGGQGSGLRITKAEWDAARNTVPFWQQVEAKFAKGPDGIEYMTGTPLAPQQVDQMIQAMHAKTKSIYDNVNAAKQRVADQKKADMEAGGLTPKAAPAASFDWNQHPVAQ